MQRLVALALAAWTLAGVVGQSAVAEDPAAPQKQPGKPSVAEPKGAGLADFVIGDPVRFQNLTVFPVASRLPRNEDRYLTLDEGLKAGTVQVFEVGAEPGADGRPAAGSAPRTTNENPFSNGQQGRQ